MTFNWPIIGHTAAVQFLQTALVNCALHHAYLLCGPQGVGKTTLAHFFVRSLLCQARPSFARQNLGGQVDPQRGVSPCSSCSACRMLEKHIHPDVMWVQRREERVIPIASVRSLIERLGTTSFLHTYKVAIIEEAEYLTLEAANALLKVLEEPPRNTIFILTAPATTLLPATVVSRLQVLPLRLQGASVIERALQDGGMSHDEARSIAHMSYGRPGRAQHFRQKILAKQWHEGIHRAQAFVHASIGARVAMIPDMLKDYGEEDMLMMLNAAGREALLHTVDKGEPQELSQSLVIFLKGLFEIPQLIARNIPVRVAFEYAAVTIA